MLVCVLKTASAAVTAGRALPTNQPPPSPSLTPRCLFLSSRRHRATPPHNRPHISGEGKRRPHQLINNAGRRRRPNTNDTQRRAERGGGNPWHGGGRSRRVSLPAAIRCTLVAVIITKYNPSHPKRFPLEDRPLKNRTLK